VQDAGLCVIGYARRHLMCGTADLLEVRESRLEELRLFPTTCITHHQCVAVASNTTNIQLWGLFTLPMVFNFSFGFVLTAVR
jgi:hypothetical protein